VKRCRHPFTVLLAALFLATACDSGEDQLKGSDFAVLTQHADAYQQAKPGQALSFPRDHGPHPGFRIEWWYLTANLNDVEGKPYGAQWTLFRLAVEPPGTLEPGSNWQRNQIFMAHMAITTPDDHVSFQRYARGAANLSLARAGIDARPFSARLDDWILQSTGTDWLPLEVQARQDEYALHLKLQSDAAPILQGDRGFSQKHPDGGGSFYYSQPFLKAIGELTVAGQTIPVSGEAWLDREWGSQFLQTDQVGWDWFSLHLESGEKLMLFQLRQKPGINPDSNFLYGSLIAPDGSTRPLDTDQIKLAVLQESVVMGRNLPVRWRIELPSINRYLKVEALHSDQWMDVDFPYWEGVVAVNGDGPQNNGQGYMELTGYPANTTQP
jgi:predicted secreted hydrolase